MGRRNRKSRTRVYGPEKHRSKWRLRLRAPDGTWSTEAFETESEAARTKRAIEAALDGESAWGRVARLEEELAEAQAIADAAGSERIVGDLIDDYIMYRRQSDDLSEVTLDRYARFFRELLKPVLNSPAAAITSRRAGELYIDRTKQVSPDTHRGELRMVKSVWCWAADRRFVRPGVWDRVKPIGKRKKGKVQLRPSEARRLYAECLRRADGHRDNRRTRSRTDGALAILVAVLLGLRASEIVNGKGRDIDEGVWYVEDSKTPTGRRTVEIPEPLLARLERRAAEVGANDHLFPHRSDWPNYQVKKICEQLKLPKVTAHSLRGLHASLAKRRGTTSHAIAATLGHEGTQVTERHYISKEAREAGRAADRRAMIRALDEGQSGSGSKK